LPNQIQNSGQYSPEFLAAFEKRLLQVFQLSSPPKPSPESYSAVPKILSDIYKSQQGELDEDHQDYFWIEDHLSEKTNIIKHHPMSHNYESSSFGNTAHHLKFDFNLKEHEQHHRTELFLHTEQMANNSLINLYKMQSPTEREKIFTQRVLSGGDIQRIDLTNIADQWNGDENNFGLQIEIENGSSDHFRMRRSAGSELDDSPVLLSYIDDGSPSPKLSRSRRRTRTDPSRRRKSKKRLCQRRELYVDFSMVDWHQWIVAPPGYQAYICDGKCSWPMDNHLNVTNHAIFNSYVKEMNPTETDGACCIPTSLSSLHLLYLDQENRAVLKAYEDMIVDECGCR